MTLGLFQDPAVDRRPTYRKSFGNSRAVTEFGWQITGLNGLTPLPGSLGDVETLRQGVLFRQR